MHVLSGSLYKVTVGIRNSGKLKTYPKKIHSQVCKFYIVLQEKKLCHTA